MTPLFSACRYNEWECVRLLLEHGANPNHQRYNQDTPLHFAAAHDAEACLATLVGFGAVIDATNRKGRTPKDSAKLRSNRRCFFALLKMERQLALQEAIHERDYPDTAPRSAARGPTTNRDIALATYMQ